MTVTKEAMARVTAAEETESLAAELEQVNLLSKTPLTTEQVYLFSVRLCDNQVDRDDELFDCSALEQLAPMFVGKSGIFDHEWSAKNQAARIYRTEVVQEAGIVEESGESRCFLKGFAYMLRTEENQALIAEIEAGIKKEVSVSCAVSRSVCSICGNDMADRQLCGHAKGRYYEGRRCVAKLQDPVDAYEWSFVAVPAQRSAGVMKALQRWAEKQMPESGQDAQGVEKTLSRLEEEAALGRKYLAGLRQEVVRLGVQAEFKADALEGICKKLDEAELLQMKAVYETQARKRFPVHTQLPHQQPEQTEMLADTVFCI